MTVASESTPINAVDIETRVGAYDWTKIAEHLDAHGWASFPKLLAEERSGRYCRSL